ncbi:MAG: type II secretion system F family protein [Armatimonadetes bacterium]|nr:type II secretion system F family protein [Armatimonadota bacterium]
MSARVFFFKAIDEYDNVVQGSLRAKTPGLAREKLKEIYARVLVLQEKEDAVAQTASYQQSPSVRVEDLSVYTRQLAAMINGGITVNRAFRFVSQGDSKRLNHVMQRVADAIEEGKSISQALQEQPRVFSATYVALVAAGEKSGALDRALNKLADLLEKNVRLKKRITSTFAYPTVIATVAFGIIGLFVFYIVPMLLPMFNSVGLELPLPTKILINASVFLSNPQTGIPLVAGLLGIILATVVTISDPQRAGPFRLWIDQTLLTIPIFGKLVEMSTSARILYTMSTMLDSGVLLVETMKTCESVAGNLVISRKLRDARDSLVSGVGLYQSLAMHEVFGMTALQMIKVGEETGRLSDMTGRVGRLYEEDAEMQLDNIASMIEPLLMGIMGIVVGFIVIASFMPMINLVNSL